MMLPKLRRRQLLAAATLPLAGGALAFGATPQGPREIELDLQAATTPLDRFFDHCVGSDFPGTLIRDDCQAQLKTAVDELGFRYLRFHAIFHDVLKTVRREATGLVFDFTRIDQLYDGLLARRIRPFVELGFTPEALASSRQTIFYWKGNTSHPQPEGWVALIDAFIRHLLQRYGAAEVRQWYFEVWNEPNLDGFWEGADKPAYFELYERTARAIKAVDPQLRVGGPSTAGAAWVPEFLAQAKATNTPVDFITTHTYGVSGGFLDEQGKEDTWLSADDDAIVGDVRRVRAQIEASHLPGLPLFFTEWSTSYNPRDKVHDSYMSAAYVLNKLRRTRGLAQSMSYWTYTDLFEEPGPPDAPFHGGFGLMTREGLRKPVWFAYKYLAALQGLEIPSRDRDSLATVDGGKLQLLVWDWRAPAQTVSNRSYFGKPQPARAAGTVQVSWRHLPPGRYRVQQRRTGYHANDAHTAYLEMGSPAELDAKQLAALQALTTDAPETLPDLRVGADGKASLTLSLRAHDVILLSLEPSPAPAASLTPMRDLDSLQLSRLMGAGWNLGNALESIGSETAWGNPATTQTLIDAIKDAGFKTIRIPLAWKQYADAGDQISPRWMARVTEVVGYARKAGLYTIINVHWDGGWLQPTLAAQPAANARLARFWTQIATHFNNHDDKLLFAGTNEVMVEGDYGTPKPEYIAVQNGFNQIFVDTVRATGGNNAVRHLIVQGFNTNIDHSVNFAVMPKDTAKDRLMMEVHFYDPYDFTINEKSTIWQWGATATDPKATQAWADEAHVDAQFGKMKTRFVDRGIPVILGEFCAMRRSEFAGAEAYRLAWDRHVARSAWAHGMVPIYWDAGMPADPHSSGLFDRRTGAQVYPDIIRALVEAVSVPAASG
jgi:xylan 1,4-beta-xylosidase